MGVMLEILSGRRNGPAARSLRGALTVASYPYAGFMRLRRWGYRRGLLPSRRASAPVISVGNLTTGGTGKTPMVAWLCRRLTAMGRSPAVLTRGYKIANGLSDEARLLERLAEVSVVIDPDRVAGADRAIADGADLLVMDDGFQHRRLARDLDIVLIDATCPFGGGRCLPAGLLREPPAALADADAVVLTRCDRLAADELDALARRLARCAPRATLHQTLHAPAALLDPFGQPRPLTDLAGRKVFAFCALGNPEAFFHTLGKLGAKLVGESALPDHAPYPPQTITGLTDQARRAGASVLVTTQKDGVKLDPSSAPAEIWQLAVEIRFRTGEPDLLDKLARL
jgi:tetraacyldisaccharide 4'-kinase